MSESFYRRTPHCNHIAKHLTFFLILWSLLVLNLSYLIKKNKKGSYIHFKIKGNGVVINELEKNESLDKKLLRYLTVKVKKFDLETNYFSKKDESEKKESVKN